MGTPADGGCTAAEHHDLAIALIWRELVVRYKRSAFGVLWALAEPVSVVAVYVVVFGHIFGAAKNVDNYAFFSLFGVLPWLFFSATLDQGSNVLLDHAPLARKIFFPWELLVVAVVVSRFSTLFIGCVIGLAVAALTGAPLAWGRIWLMPCGAALVIGLTFGMTLFASGMQALLRDTGFLVRFALRVGFFACPIVYTMGMVPESWRPLYECNPLVGVTWMFQAVADSALPAPSVYGVAASVLGAGLSIVGGLWGFRRMRDAVADVL